MSNSPVTVYASRSPADVTDGAPGGDPAPTRAFPASAASGTDAPNPPWWTPAGQSARRASLAAAGGRADEDRAAAGARAPATLAAAASGLRTAIVRVARWGRRHPVEAVAVLLLGVGGVVFPPVWLAGALVALASRRWDSTDKWVALALPIVLTVLGLVAGMTVSGHNGISHEIHQGWAYADVISRLTAFLSAVYLAWRATRARRVPPQPPWNRLRDGG